MPFPAGSAGALGRSSFPSGSTQGAPAPQSCPCHPLGCAGTSGTGAPPCLPPLPHLTQHFSPSQSSWSQHHIQHSLTTEPPSCLLSQQLLQCPRKEFQTPANIMPVLPLPKLHKGGTQGVGSGILCAEMEQDDRTSCTTPYISKLCRALPEKPFHVSMEQPPGKVRGHLWDLGGSSNLGLFMGRALVEFIPNISQS